MSRYVTVYDIYKKQMDPRDEPHTILANVWIEFARKRGSDIGKSLSNNSFALVPAMTETFAFSCLEYPANARALGIFMMAKHNPNKFASNPKYGAEFEILMEPYEQAKRSDRLDSLYARLNPNLSKEPVSEEVAKPFSKLPSDDSPKIQPRPSSTQPVKIIPTQPDDDLVINKIYAKVADEMASGKIDAGLMLRVRAENPGASELNDIYARVRASQYLAFYNKRQAETARIEKERKEKEKRVANNEAKRQTLEFKNQLFNSLESEKKLISFRAAIDDLDKLKNDAGGALVIGGYLLICMIFTVCLLASVPLEGDGSLIPKICVGLEVIGFIWLMAGLDLRREKIRKMAIESVILNFSHVQKMLDWGHEDAKIAIEKLNSKYPEIDVPSSGVE